MQSTPKSRRMKRVRAQRIGEVQTFLSSQPVLLAVVAGLLLLGAWLERFSM